MSEPKKVGRRTFLNYAIAVVATGVIVGAATYFAVPKEVTTVTAPGTTVTKTVTTTVTGTPTTTPPTTTTSPTTPPGKPKLTAWYRMTFLEDFNVYLREKTLEWAQKRGVEVELSQLPFTEIYAKLTAAVDAGNPPDISLWAPLALAAEKPETRLLLPVDDVINEIGRDDFFEPSIKVGTIEGKAYQLSLWCEPYLWHIRKDVLEKKGIQVKTPLSWIDAKEIAEKVNDPANDFYGLGITLGMNEDTTNQWNSLWWSFGGQYYTSKRASGVTLKSSATRKAVEYLVDAYKRKLIPPDAVEWDSAGNNKCYMGGRGMMVMNPASIMYSLSKDNPDLFNKTLLVYPPIVFGGTNGFVIYKTCKYPDLAKDLLVYILSDKKSYTERFIKPSQGYCCPIFKSVAEEMKKIPYWEPFANAAEFTYGSYPFNEPCMALDEAGPKYIIVKMLQKIILEGQDIDAAIDWAHNEYVSIFRKYYGD
jgi:multiple sugar transport system substrate-binding protein